jgi:hypothetical protein
MKQIIRESTRDCEGRKGHTKNRKYSMPDSSKSSNTFSTGDRWRCLVPPAVTTLPLSKGRIARRKFHVVKPIKIVAVAVVANAIAYVAVCTFRQNAGFWKVPTTISDPTAATQYVSINVATEIGLRTISKGAKIWRTERTKEQGDGDEDHPRAIVGFQVPDTPDDNAVADE